MLVLLMTAVSGAWAQDTYKIDAVYTIPSGSQDLSIEDAASLPFTKKLSELDPYSSLWKENNIDAANITVSGDNIVKGTDANWDTEITFNGAGTATVSYGFQDTNNGVLGSATITFTVTKNAPAATNYTVTLKEGTEDANNWTITPAEATTTGVAAGTEVKATYSGTKKVKSVKAKKKQ